MFASCLPQRYSRCCDGNHEMFDFLFVGFVTGCRDSTHRSSTRSTNIELDGVNGGAAPKLYEAASKGVHIPVVIIEL